VQRGATSVDKGSNPSLPVTGEGIHSSRLPSILGVKMKDDIQIVDTNKFKRTYEMRKILVELKRMYADNEYDIVDDIDDIWIVNPDSKDILKISSEDDKRVIYLYYHDDSSGIELAKKLAKKFGIKKIVRDIE
jgi:hypothetical protein